MSQLLWVCLGGALGTGARYLLSRLSSHLLGTAFPYGTLFINTLGCFLISFIMHLGRHSTLLSPTVFFTLTVGVLGGFTTCSTFNYDPLTYLQQGAYVWGFFNLGLTVVLCFAAGLLGLWVAKLCH